MTICKKISSILGIVIYILVGLILNAILFVYPLIRFRIISHWTRTLNRFLRLILGIRVIVEGDSLCLKEKGNFIISNHLGYLDGVVLGSLFAVVYVSKNQVRTWPLFGLMTAVAGTIFIDRQRKNKTADYIHQTTKMLERKVNVLVFPEGTSTNGERLLDFQSVHFQASLNSKSPVLPVTINYTKINKTEVHPQGRDRVCWYGQVNFLEHLLGVLKLNCIEAKVRIYPKIDLANPLGRSFSRKELAESLYKIILNSYPLS